MKTLLFLFLPICLAAQRDAARLEIGQINLAYSVLTELRTEVDYVMFATHSSTKPIDTERATLSRSGDSYLYKLGPVETLTTPLFTITADHEDKALILDKVRGKPSEKQFGLNLEATFDACEAVIVSSPAPGFRLIQFDLLSSDVERAELRFDAMSRKMQKVTLFYREAEEWEAGKPPTKARMEIIYRKQAEKPVFASDLFSVERFARKVNGRFVPATAFKDYEFHDNTDFQ